MPKDPRDLDGDGKVSAQEKAATAAAASRGVTPTASPTGAGGLLSEVNAGPTTGGSDPTLRGAPLVPYDASPEALAQVKFKRSDSGVLANPRYYESDALKPAQWSPEKTAQLQKAMAALGLYGDQKTRLGTWSAADAKVLKGLMTQANINGRTYSEQIREWMIRPDRDAMDAISGGGEARQKPTIQLSNPLDIQEKAREVSRSLLGKEDRSFVQSSVGAFQGQESAYQSDQNALAVSGGGGSDTAQPSADAFLMDKLRREKPLEVDGHTFVKQFGSFLGMMGAQGGEHL